MKNLAKLQLETQRSKAKTKPMASARVARAVPQMRKAIKTITGRKDGGTMTNPKKIDRVVSKYEDILTKKKDKDRLTSRDVFLANEIVKDKDISRKISKNALEGAKEILKMLREGAPVGKRSGGVIRPKPTFKGKVLKPKPIKSRGIGMAIRGFGKAFKKGR
jgi:hypothetical protein